MTFLKRFFNKKNGVIKKDRNYFLYTPIGQIDCVNELETIALVKEIDKNMYADFVYRFSIETQLKIIEKYNIKFNKATDINRVLLLKKEQSNIDKNSGGKVDNFSLKTFVERIKNHVTLVISTHGNFSEKEKTISLYKSIIEQHNKIKELKDGR